MSTFAQAWCEKLRADLAGYADPKTPINVVADGSTISAEWTVRGKGAWEAFMVESDGTVSWVGDSEGATYADFLSSERMADLSQLAAAIERSIDTEPMFVASDAVIEGMASTEEILATPEEMGDLASAGREAGDARTQLYFLKGAPGAGKTTLLQQMTRLQAKSFLAGESDFLFFYVSAQGRELSNLRDAFSGELDDLRAAFTRDAIASLVRAGLLIPVVDGFDELLGTAGYSGAFSSLQSLLNDLEGRGSLMVSARSSFYDTEFLGRSMGSSSDADLLLSAIDLKPWSDDQLTRYLSIAESESEPERAQIQEALATLNPHDRQLLNRPFFARQFLNFAGELSGGASLIDHLIAAYLVREAKKIVDSTGDPVLEPAGHHRLFELVAGEMWQSESRTINVEDLRAITEIVAEEFGLSADQAAQLTTKITSYAGFESGGKSGEEFAFEHEVYFDHFLSQSIQRLISDGDYDDLMLAMDSGVVPDAVARSAIRALEGHDHLPEPLRRVGGGITKDNRRRNIGSLVVAFASTVSPVANGTLNGLHFVDCDARGSQFERVEFDGCNFVGTDLRGAKFIECDGSGAALVGVVLSDDTSMDIAGLKPGVNVGSLTFDGQGIGELYEPSKMKELLQKLDAPGAKSTDEIAFSARAEGMIALLHKLAKAYRRTNMIFAHDEHLAVVFNNNGWPDLKHLMVANGIVEEEVRRASGTKHKAYRLRVQVEELLAGRSRGFSGDRRVVAFWKDLQAE